MLKFTKIGVFKMNKRINWIDVAKGICILSVMLGHCGNSLANKIVFAYILI